MFQGVKHYGLVTYVDRLIGKVNAFTVLDATSVRKEERRLRRIIAGMIRSVPREEQPKPSLVWTNTLIDNLGAKFSKPIQLEGSNPSTLTFTMDCTGQMLLQASAMGLLQYLGFRNVLITTSAIGYMYLELPGTAGELLERLERDGVLKVGEHALAAGSSAACSAPDHMIEKLLAQQ